jgi:carbon monoxide dehydrogenase subunit G
MVQVTRTFRVNKPVETVVAFMADFGNAERWDPGTQSCTRLDSGPVQVGATWKNVSKVMGLQTELTYRLERLERARVTLVGSNKYATSTDDFAVRPIEGGSEITYDTQVELRGAATMVERIVKRELERLGDEMAKGITAAIANL